MLFLPLAALCLLGGLYAFRDRPIARPLGVLTFGLGIGLTFIGVLHMAFGATDGDAASALFFIFYPLLMVGGTYLGAKAGERVESKDAWLGIGPGLVFGLAVGFLAFCFLADGAFESGRQMLFGDGDNPVPWLLGARLWAGGSAGAALGVYLATVGKARTGPLLVTACAFVAVAAAVGQAIDLPIRLVPVTKLVERGDLDGLIEKTRSNDPRVAGRAAYALLTTPRVSSMSAPAVSLAVQEAVKHANTGEDAEGVYVLIRGEVGTVEDARRLLARSLMQVAKPKHTRRSLYALIERSKQDIGPRAGRLELWRDVIRILSDTPSERRSESDYQFLRQLAGRQNRVADEIREASRFIGLPAGSSSIGMIEVPLD